MRVLLQRVVRGEVRVAGEVVGAIGAGYVLLVGSAHADTAADARALAEKITHLRLFPDERGKFDRSLLDVGGGALVVSQFTLFADCAKGRRPSFLAAAPGELARERVEDFARALEGLGVRPVARGRFGAMMEVDLVNDGPVTILLDGAAP